MDPIRLEIDGIGPCEMRAPTVGDLAAHIGEMTENGQGFLIRAISCSMYKDGAQIEGVLDKIPFYDLTRLIGYMSGLLGFEPDDESDPEAGND